MLPLLFQRFAPRLITLLLIAVALMLGLYFIAPQQVTVALYKLTLVSVAVVLGYWIDRAMFPYARPDSFLVDDWRRTTVAEFGAAGAVDYAVIDGYERIYAAAMIRRALVIMAVAISVAMGL